MTLQRQDLPFGNPPMRDPDDIDDLGYGFEPYDRRRKRRGAWGWLLGFVSRLTYPFRRIWRMIAVVHAAMWEWCVSRPYQRLWLGLPVIVVGVVAAGFSAVVLDTSTDRLQQQYRDAAVEAKNDQRWDDAEFYYRRLAQYDNARPMAVYGLALVANERGDRNRARQLMNSAAPKDAAGYWMAHAWLVEDLLMQGEHSELSLELAAELEQRLGWILEEYPEHPAAHETMGQLRLAEQRLDEAADHFTKAAKRPDASPKLLLSLAGVYLQLGRTFEGEEAADRARRYFRSREPRKWTTTERLWWAQAELLKRDHAPAAQALIQGLPDAANDDEIRDLRRALGAVHMTWFDHVTRTNPGDIAFRVEILQQAMGWAPGHPEVLNRLAMLFSHSPDNPEIPFESLRQALAEGNAPPTVHLILGTAALLKGEHDQATTHLEVAFQQFPQTAGVLNNLAWALAQRAEPDLLRAEQLINSAVQLDPQEPEFRDTRGQILSRLGKRQEAIAELELAVRAFPNRRVLHQILATLYEEQGDPALAEAHRKLAYDIPATATRTTPRAP